jgi:hypothetical protein
MNASAAHIVAPYMLGLGFTVSDCATLLRAHPRAVEALLAT